MKPEMREFKMYLPLYDGVTNLEIGIDSLAQIVKPDAKNQKPIVFYGTSITQGCSASRPGMVHTNIISRKLNVECINLGFNGNGKMEKTVAEIMSEIDASCFVIDGTANMTPAEVHENAAPMVKIIRKKHPSTPIVFVECLMFEKAFFEDSTRNFVNSRNNALKTEFEKMTNIGTSNLYYIENRDAIGSDHEATVDGVHFTDLGYLRYADFLIAKFDELNLINTIKNEKKY
jgi:lysophospholipase L1-like esterase